MMAPRLVASENDRLQVLRHSRSMKNALDKIVADIEKGDLNGLKSKISTVCNNLSGFEDHLSATIEPRYYANDRSEDSTVAVKVFAIPELLETILSNLGVEDLIRCYAVSRTFRDTLERSIKLQTKLFLRPAPENSPVRCPFKFKNFECKYNDWTARSENEVNVTIRTSRGGTTALTSIGSRWKRMLVRQPPAYCMSYSICCYPEGMRNAFLNRARNDSHRPNYLIRSEEGLTVGDLYEAARRLFEDHSACTDQTSKFIIVKGPMEDS